MRSFGIIAVLWASSFIVYQTTFIFTPRLFLFPEAEIGFADIPEYAAALRGRPNETDMRKHLLYYPIGRLLYRLVNWARLRFGINRDAIALVFPGALYGAASVALAYLLFFRSMKRRRLAAAAAACYAFTYSVWLMSSVTESYALMTLSVNLFLYFVLTEKIEPNRRWCLSAIVLIAFSSLCDVRSLLLLIVPFYIIAGTSGMKRTQKIGAMFFITVGTLCLVAATYESYKWITGNEGFGIYMMYKWFPEYGGSNIPFSHTSGLRSIFGALLTFFVESISPLYHEHLDQSSMTIKAIHLSLAYCFLAVSIILVFGGLRHICKCLLSSLSLQAFACWLLIYIIFNTFCWPWPALHFSPPIVLPLLLIILPGIFGAWTRRRFGVAVLSAIVVIILANNLIVINEGRSVWQLPDIIQTPDDRVYLLPGEIERMRFLAHKGVLMLPGKERRRLVELKAKHRSSLTERDRQEIDELTNKALESLARPESEEAIEIFQRYKAVIRLARGER